MEFPLINDPDKFYSNYLELTDYKDEIKVLYFEKFQSIFEGLETYRYLHCFIIYLESLLEINEYRDIDKKIDEAIIQSLNIGEKDKFLIVYSILLFHKAQVKYLTGKNEEALKVIIELIKIKKADEDSIDLLFHTIATPAPKYIDKFHNLSVLLLLFTAVLLGCGLFLGKSNQTSINLFIHYGVCVSFVLGLISAFGADLFHYIDCKIKVISILKKHPVNLEHEHNSKY